MSELNRSELMNELVCRIRWEDAETEAERFNLKWVNTVTALELAIENEGRANFAAWGSKEEAAWRKLLWEKVKNANLPFTG